MGEGTSNPLEVGDMEWAEGGDHGMDDGWEGVVRPELVLVREQAQARGDVGDEMVGVAAEDNVQAAEVGNGHIHQVDSNRMEGDHSFHIGSEEVGVHTG